MAFSESQKAKIRRRAHLACCLCKTVGVEIHHIIPQAEDGPDTEDNAAPLCPSCHSAYGANPEKRKFIREARDLWYEICGRRYKSDVGQLEEIKDLLKRSVSYQDFIEFKEEMLFHLNARLETPRTKDEIDRAIDEYFDKLWYGRHKYLVEKHRGGEETIDPEVLKRAQEAAAKIEEMYPREELGPHDDFQWGMINGKLSALRWVMGDEWDFLDT